MAFQRGDTPRARELVEVAERLRTLQGKVEELQRGWLEASPPVSPKTRSPRRKGRLPKGLRTPEEAFRRPILEALVELGGRAPAKEVLDLVEHKMRDKLTPYDWERLRGNKVRWRNTAQWCRNTLREEGLLKGDSPGVWEITEKGRQALEGGWRWKRSPTWWITASTA